MGSLNPSEIPLNQTNITGRRKPDVELDALRQRYKIDKETQQRTEELEGYVADIVARNRIQSVKLPLDAVDETTFKQIQEALVAKKVVTVNFGETASTLRGKFYALISKTTGQLISGISCTASVLNVVAINELVDDEFDDDILLD